MSKPRRVLPGTTYLISRRCSEGRFFLTPDAKINQCVLYCLAYAAQTCGMQVHAVCAMSNHWHVVVTDPYGAVSAFMHRAHLLLSKCINEIRGRSESMWVSDEPSCVELPDEPTIVAKMLYVMANPVSAGLVARAKEWPGVCLGPQDLGTTLEVERPTVYFRDGGPAPARVALPIVPPAAAVARRPLQALVDDLAEQLRGLEREAKRPVLGREAIKAQDWSACPGEPPARPRARPRVAGVVPAVFRRALAEMREFWDRYADARQRFLEGEIGVEFPAGTYALAATPGVVVAAAPG